MGPRGTDEPSDDPVDGWLLLLLLLVASGRFSPVRVLDGFLFSVLSVIEVSSEDKEEKKDDVEASSKAVIKILSVPAATPQPSSVYPVAVGSA